MFPNPQEVAIVLLRAALAASTDPVAANVTVAVELPRDATTGQPARPTRCVQVRRDGGAGRDRHGVYDEAVLTLRCWHDTEYQAERLAQLCRDVIFENPGAVELTSGTAVISGVADVAPPIPVPDPLDSSVTSYFARVLIRLRRMVTQPAS